MCKMIVMFILLFIGYLCNNEIATANSTMLSYSTTLSYSSSPAFHVTQDPESETIPDRNSHIPGKSLSALIVSGISICFVFILILVIIGVSCAWKKSRASLAAINSVSSGEPGVSLRQISAHENQCEWPCEKALQ